MIRDHAPAYARRSAAAKAEGASGRRSRIGRGHRWAPRTRVAPLWILGKMSSAPPVNLEMASGGDDAES